MSFSQNRDIKDDFAVWQDSFGCLTIFEAIKSNIVVESATCVHDINFRFIVILGVLRCRMLGPLCIVRETKSLCIIEERFGVSFTVGVANCYKVFFFE